MTTLMTTDGTRIHHRVEGTGEPAMVFVPGWCSNLTHWSDETRDGSSCPIPRAPPVTSATSSGKRPIAVLPAAGTILAAAVSGGHVGGAGRPVSTTRVRRVYDMRLMMRTGLVG